MMALLEKDLFINVYIKIICFYCIYIYIYQIYNHWIGLKEHLGNPCFV